MLRQLFKFYSVWVLVFHLLFLLGILDNTFVLALFVCVGWLFLSFVYPNWHKLYPKEFYQMLPLNILLHFAPFLFLPARYENYHYIPITLALYLLVTPDFKKVYDNPFVYLIQ
jgi:hypothetical protein